MNGGLKFEEDEQVVVNLKLIALTIIQILIRYDMYGLYIDFGKGKMV